MNIVIEAYNKGYRMIDGILYNPKGKAIRGSVSNRGYKTTKIEKKGKALSFHRLVAYQKYGNKMFEDGIEVRHKDGDSLNNSEDNIAIGNHSDNIMDKPKEQRIKDATHRKHDYDAIREFYNRTKSYKRTMERFGISSKGSLNYILG